MLDFLSEVEDTDNTGAPETEAEQTEVVEEAEAEEATTEEDQDDQTDVEEDAEADDADEELEVIDIDGEEVTLKQIKEWKRGTLREQDYTKKTQALADERKAIEAKLGELNTFSESLSAGEEEFKKLALGDLEEIDLKALRNDDYPEYLKIKEMISEREGKFEELKKVALKAREATIAEEQKAVNELLGWSDKSKREADVGALQDYAKEAGFTERDSNSITSAKVMSALIELANLKKAAVTADKPAPKPKHKKVKFKSSTTKTQRAAPATQEDRIDSFFS